MAKLKTGRHTSALKQNRKAERCRLRNITLSSKVKTISKKVETAVTAKDEKSAKDLLNSAFSVWDKAVKKNIIHANTASNQKARLSKLVASIAG